MRFFRPLFQATSSMKPTGYPGIPQHPNPHATLKDYYSKTLNALTHLPATSLYRLSTTELTQSRLNLVNQYLDRESLANQLGEPIEFAIDQAESELELVQEMQQWKAWEPLQEKPLEDQWEYKFSENKLEQR